MGAVTRVRHWRLGLRYPLFLVGTASRVLLAVLPAQFIDRLTGRNCLSDKFRSIDSGALRPHAER
jgi:hypothetical protein